MTGTRLFTFPPNSQLQQKERTKAVAWATSKVGGWRSDNVTRDIQRYLREAGFKVDQNHVKYSMEYLVRHELAISVVVGRRTVEFILAPDVELEEPDFLKAQRARARAHGPEPDTAPVLVEQPTVNGSGTTTAAAPPDRGPLPGRGRNMPRLPSATRRDPERLDDLLVALRTWYRTDPEACELWIAGVLYDLGID